MMARLPRFFQQSAALYVLFLLPTLLLALYAGQSDALISRQMTGVWQASFWHFPGLSATVSRVLLDILDALAVGGLGILFFQGWRTLLQTSHEERPALTRLIFMGVAVCAVILLAVVPFHSSDLYGYLNRGFQQSVYGTNPYLTPVVKIPGWQQEPLFHPHWVYNPCPYGFFFAQLTAWLTGWFGRSFVAAFLGFKTLNLILFLGTTALILKLSRQLRLPRPELAAYAFGANPLVLLHVMANGHNDIGMVFLLLAAIWTVSLPRWRWAVLPLLTLSVLMKYASLLSLPFVGLYLLKSAKGRRDWLSLLLGGLLSVALLLLLAAPYVDPHQAWPWADMLDNAGKPQHSLVDLLARAVYYPIKWVHGPATDGMDWTLRALKPLFWGGFVLFYLRQVWQFARQKADLTVLVAAIAIPLTVMVACISSKFHPWYTVMFLPLLLLLPENNRWRHFGLTFSLFQLAGFTIFQNLPVISPLALTVLPLWLAYRRRSPVQG